MAFTNMPNKIFASHLFVTATPQTADHFLIMHFLDTMYPEMFGNIVMCDSSATYLDVIQVMYPPLAILFRQTDRGRTIDPRCDYSCIRTRFS